MTNILEFFDPLYWLHKLTYQEPEWLDPTIVNETTDLNDRPVLYVEASTSRAASDVTNGVNYPGSVYQHTQRVDHLGYYDNIYRVEQREYVVDGLDEQEEAQEYLESEYLNMIEVEE